ncbi:flagellar basal body-associated protein FliL [Pelotomaculum schinkii]|uniref:Flagellar protein FliL n=1 Tax=Pelotomaculum schinkii TaxID=78350 RepID=A0A4Y7R838_9FIRM|nr:flagellar basal body-associated FliL family protein [Pelotomaculum schinkii]TEB04942.1 flagellar basal body-associated protein FliL [Pelotomaculum schinkii]
MPISNTSENQVRAGKKAKPKKKKIILILLIGLMFLAGSSAGAYFYFNKPAGAASEVQKAAVPKTTETESLDMGEMVVNLAGDGGGHYLRVKITLEYPKEKKLREELKKKKVQVLDAMIMALRSKTLEEVAPVGASDALKKSLLNVVNNNLDCGEVVGIYFTDYLVQ